MRKSILACTVSALMSPVASWALGLGDIQVNSTLNQALNAEIALHSVTKKDLDSLHIGLASNQAYARAGIDRSDFLSKFKFEIVQRGGKNLVTISTNQPFKEPFANFLIEVTWGSGRILREYTMLVDPPEFVKMNAKPVVTTAASTAPVSQVKRTPKPEAKPVQKKTAKPVTAEKPKVEPETKKQDVVLTPKKADDKLAEEKKPATVIGSSELVYGPTQKHDTLWSIAKGMAPEGVSIDQMMLALLRDNPEAFINNNINNLKAGYVLRIKDRESLNMFSKSAARQEVQEQLNSWKETRKQKVSTKSIVDRSDRSADKKKVDGELKLVAAGDKDKTTTAKGSLAAEANELKEKLAMAGEDLESKEIENQELRERVKELEKILETKSSLVKLKDENLAALQKQKEMAEKERADAMEAAKVSEQKPVVEEVPVVKEEKIVEDLKVVEDVKVAAVDDISDHIDPSVELAAQEQAKMPEPVKAEPVAPVKPKEEVKKPEIAKKPKPKPKPVKKPQPAPEPDLIEQLTGEYLPYTAGGAGLLVLILAWLGLRGRGKKTENEFEESILDSKMDIEDESDFSLTEDSDLVEPESSTEVVSNDAETSFLSDFSSDDMESLQPDDTEADPISEADVFMVYGRYQQAEELLKSAIDQEPDRIDYQMKLLEVYQGDNQKDEFAIQADVVRDALKKTNDDYEITSEWTKAKSWAEKLGVDIDMPDSFDEAPAEQTTGDDELSIDADELTLDEVPDEESIESDIATDDLSLDDISDELTLDTDELSLDDLDTEEATSDELDMSIDMPEESSEELDMSLDMPEDTSEDLDISLDDNSLDFDTDLELEETDDNEGTIEFDSDLSIEEETTSETENMLDLELEETPDIETDDVEDSSLELDEGMDLDLDESLDLDDADLAIDSGETESMESSEDELDLLDEDMDLDELDEDYPELDAVGTKLDLAKAYIDMGDMDSASSILNEVIDEGNDEQKAQAQELLSQTGS